MKNGLKRWAGRDLNVTAGRARPCFSVMQHLSLVAHNSGQSFPGAELSTGSTLPGDSKADRGVGINEPVPGVRRATFDADYFSSLSRRLRKYTLAP
jgi:hypothetical protein